MSAFFNDEPDDQRDLARASTAVDVAPAESALGTATDSDDGSDDDFIPKPPFRFAPLSIALLALIVIGAGFIGGVLVQKHHDQGSSTSTRGGTAARAGGFPGGAGGEGFSTGGGAGLPTATSAGTGTGTATPAVIGTVSSVSGQTIVVKNLGGKSVTVHLSSATKVTTSWGVELQAGRTVSVAGAAATDGSVTATAVTVSS